MRFKVTGKEIKELSRKCIVIEKEVQYIEVIKERLDATSNPLF